MVGVTLASSLLTACYVVPVNRNPPPVVVYVAPAAQAPNSVTFAARLYPAKDIALAYGVINAAVTNELNGGGIFTTNINGENFSGEATRAHAPVDSPLPRRNTFNGRLPECGFCAVIELRLTPVGKPQVGV